MEKQTCRHGIKKGEHCTLCCNAPGCALCKNDIDQGLPGIYLQGEREVLFEYVNYRGESSTRRVIPLDSRFGSTKWHPRRQWLLRAWDLDKEAQREFAMGDISNWRPASK